MHRLDHDGLEQGDVRNLTGSVGQTTVGDPTVESASGKLDEPQSPPFPTDSVLPKTPEIKWRNGDCPQNDPSQPSLSAGQDPKEGPNLGLVLGPSVNGANGESAGQSTPNRHNGKSNGDWVDGGNGDSDAKVPGRDSAIAITADNGELDQNNAIPEMADEDLQDDLTSVSHPKYQPGGEWAYANELTGRTFFVTQYREHSGSGKVLLSEDTVISVTQEKGVSQYQWILHDKDHLTAQEAAATGRKAGELKDPHFHVVVVFKSTTSIGAVARKFGVAPQYVEKKGGRGSKGVFWDLAEYLTHEHPKQQQAGKYRYSDEDVHTNVSKWREQLDAHIEKRSGNGKEMSLRKREDQLCLRVLRGELTVRQALEEDDEAYSRCSERVRRNRGEYLRTLKPPANRMNYYICGQGRTGKSTLAKAFARSLYPDLEDNECFYIVSEKQVSFQAYDGQPVIIYDDFRAYTFIEMFGREETFRMFDPHPHAVEKNIKYGSVPLINAVSIVTGVQPYEDFCDGLAGKYRSKDGTQHLAEDDKQSYGRFPFFNNVETDKFIWYMNQSYVDGVNYREYREILRVEQNMRDYNEMLASLDDESAREVTTAVGNAWFSRLIELSHPDRLLNQKLGNKDQVLAELTAPGKVRQNAASIYGKDAYFDLGSGALRRANELFIDQLDGLVPVSEIWVGIARAKQLLEVIRELKVTAKPEAEWVAEFDECVANLADYEVKVSAHPLFLASVEERHEVLADFVWEENRSSSREWHALAVEKIREIRAWIDGQGPKELAA